MANQLNELEATIETRHSHLTELLVLTTQQEAAIALAHMNELMRLLFTK